MQIRIQSLLKVSKKPRVSEGVPALAGHMIPHGQADWFLSLTLAGDCCEFTQHALGDKRNKTKDCDWWRRGIANRMRERGGGGRGGARK